MPMPADAKQHTNNDLWKELESTRSAVLEMKQLIVAQSKATEDSGIDFETMTVAVKPWKKVLTMMTWVAAAIGAVFAAGIAYQQFVVQNATKGDLEKYDTDVIQPLKHQVDEIKASTDKMNEGVDKLLAERKRQQLIERKRSLLEAYRSEYQEDMADYTASKAAGQSVRRPQKSKEQIDLEVELRALLIGEE